MDLERYPDTCCNLAAFLAGAPQEIIRSIALNTFQCASKFFRNGYSIRWWPCLLVQRVAVLDSTHLALANRVNQIDPTGIYYDKKGYF